MTQQPHVAPATEIAHPILRIFLIALVAVAAVVLLTAIVGIAGAGPSIDVVPDPAGMLPF